MPDVGWWFLAAGAAGAVAVAAPEVPAFAAEAAARGPLRVCVSELLPGICEPLPSVWRRGRYRAAKVRTVAGVRGLLDGGRLPSLANLRPYLFSMDAIFSPARRVCPGGDSSFLEAGSAPSNHCVHAPQRGTTVLPAREQRWFDQYAAVERAFIARWLDEGGSCGVLPADGTAPKASMRADVVVVPSFAMHCFVRRGFSQLFRYWQQNVTAQNTYWAQVHAHYHLGRSSPPLIVMHEGRFYNPRSLPSQGIIMQPLFSRLPAALRARVVRATLESNVPHPGPRALAGPGRWPGLEDWSDGAEEELARRGQRRAGRAAPLLVTLPVPTGVLSATDWTTFGSGHRPVAIMLSASRERGSNRGAEGRVHAFRALRRAGALCDDDGCVLCMPGHDCESHARRGLFALPTVSRFCVEPPGDSQLRSHLYVALAQGCVPVLFDAAHAGYRSPASQVAWWPWRLPPGREATTAPEPAGALDYREFAVRLNGSQVASGMWVKALVRMVQDGSWARLQRGVVRVAPLFQLQRRDCAQGMAAAAPCDAFDMLRRVVRRAAASVTHGTRHAAPA